MSSDFDAVAAEGIKTTRGLDNKGLRIYDTQDVYSREMDTDEVRDAVQDIQVGARVIESEQVFHNQPSPSS
jgi:hypothetical protein